MGATHVTVTIRNPADPDRAWEGLFLVATGATDSLVPRPHLEEIGLRPKGRRVYELADGREITMEITTADIEFMGETVGGTILFGAAGAEPLLGVTALESVGRNRPDQPTAEATPRGTAQAPAGTGVMIAQLPGSRARLYDVLHSQTALFIEDPTHCLIIGSWARHCESSP